MEPANENITDHGHSNAKDTHQQPDAEKVSRKRLYPLLFIGQNNLLQNFGYDLLLFPLQLLHRSLSHGNIKG